MNQQWDVSQVWDLKDLGVQAAQRIGQAADPLRSLVGVSQNFPNLAGALSRTKLDKAVRKELRQMQDVLPGGRPASSKQILDRVCGDPFPRLLLLRPSGCVQAQHSCFSTACSWTLRSTCTKCLLESERRCASEQRLQRCRDGTRGMLRLSASWYLETPWFLLGQVRLAEQLQCSRLQAATLMAVLGLRAQAEALDAQSLRLDLFSSGQVSPAILSTAFREASSISEHVNKSSSSQVVFVNDLEKQRQYRSWGWSLMMLMQPMFPGSLPRVGRNVFSLVFVIDPGTLHGLRLGSRLRQHSRTACITSKSQQSQFSSAFMLLGTGLQVGQVCSRPRSGRAVAS